MESIKTNKKRCARTRTPFATNITTVPTYRPLISAGKYKELRMAVVKDLFKQMTGSYYKNFVIYPLISGEDFLLMM